MRLTIVVPDSAVGIDGEFRELNLSQLPDNIRAVQWDGTRGHVEFNDGTPNEIIDGISMFADVVSAWNALTPEDVLELQPPPETNEQIIARLESAVDKYLNEQAESLRYESIKTIVSYRDDPNPKFKAEGIAGYQLRSAVYTSSIQLIEKVLNGIKEVPSEEELLASLPKITDYLVYE